VWRVSLKKGLIGIPIQGKKKRPPVEGGQRADGEGQYRCVDKQGAEKKPITPATKKQEGGGEYKKRWAPKLSPPLLWQKGGQQQTRLGHKGKAWVSNGENFHNRS